ncbi:MAG TPA: ATP-dependent DNA helicase RecG [Phycisphaerae bacterium]|nr:ATP-dependent DNA helicase RecG [Phycisphaerae bacterium]
MPPPRPPLTLATPVNYAKGVGEIRAVQLGLLGLKTCGDLLFHFPRDYLRFSDEAPVAEIRVGEMATIRGTLLQTRLLPRKPRRFEALLEDAAGAGPHGNGARTRCVLTWFNPYGLDKKLQPGMLIRATGKVTAFRDRLQIVQPHYEVLDGQADHAPKTARIEPVYPATTDLPSPMLAKIIANALDPLLPQIEEWFPEAHLRERNLFTRREALEKIHRPETLKDAITAKRTLAYHEFFLHQAAVAIKRFHQRNSNPAIPLRVDDAVDTRIRALLPFDLTAAQNRVIDSIRKDLVSTKPMNRLLQGDVGSGKTVVALYAMLAATATQRGEPAPSSGGAARQQQPGHQAALMAPTEILAEQHFITLARFLEGKKVQPVLLTGSVTGAERERTLAAIAEGSAGLVVGTHALLSEAVQFKSLALIVIDEQHKFGVEQRSLIRTKPSGTGVAPHTLVMTATPIPRTLAMTAFGDLDVSVIDELPPGRQPIFTKMTPASNRADVYEWLAKKLGAGEQAYIVVPAIDEEPPEISYDAPLTPEENSTQPAAPSPTPLGGQPLRNAVAVQRELQSGPLSNVRVGLIHGRMPRDTRQHIMERFRQHLIDALVATTVIEVGVDVPNATIMVVEHADRFGLSQLHQLRGRVGRGNKQSYCILLADQKTDEAVARIQAMVRHSSGFKIAEEDLKLRGMGHLIGTAQSGRTDIHFADLLFDPHLLPMSRRDAFNLIAADPRLLDSSHAVLRAQILTRFADSITLADVG